MRLFPLLLCLSLSAFAQDEPPAAGSGGRGGPGSGEPIDESTFSALRARQIGPAFVSGRISQIAVFPDDSNHYLIAVASGNIFATTNNGTTWTPVFDNYGSYSIGWITIDPTRLALHPPRDVSRTGTAASRSWGRQDCRGAWHLAGTGSLQTALSNATLRRYDLLMPSDLAGY